MAKRSTYETAIALGAKLKKSFRSSTLSATKNLSRLSEQAEKLTRAKHGAAAFRRLEKEVADASQQAKAAKARMLKLGQEIQDTAKPTFELKERFREAKKATKDSARALKKKKAQLDKTGRAMRAMGYSTQNLTSTERKLNRQLSVTQRRMKGIARMKGAVGRLKKMGGALRKVARYGAMATAALGAAVWQLGKSTADYGDKVIKTAKSVGISTDELQRLQYAAKISGMEVEEFDRSLSGVVVALGDAAKGTGPLKKDLKLLGIDAKQFAKLDTSEQLYRFADALAELDTQNARASIAAKAAGKRLGPQFALMLSHGRKGLKAMGDEAERTGNVLDPKALVKSAQFQDHLTKLSAQFQGVKHQVGVALMPVLRDLFKRMGDWISENREKIIKWGKMFAHWLEKKAIPTAVGLGKALWKIGKVIGKVISTVAELVGGYENLGKIIGMLALAKVAWNFGQMASGIYTAASGIGGQLIPVLSKLGAVCMAHPILLMVTAVAATLLLIINRWDAIQKAMHVGDEVGSGLDAAVKASGQAGELIPASVAKGIKKKAHVANKAARDMAKGMDRFLPHSDAKAGPFSRLTESGAKLAETFYAGVKRGMNGQSAAGNAIAQPLRAVLAGTGGGKGNRIINLTYSPKITMTGEGAGGLRDTLTFGADELADRIRRVLREEDRVSYE
jgi:hypothetical protein